MKNRYRLCRWLCSEIPYLRNRTSNATYGNEEERSVVEGYEWPAADRLGLPRVQYNGSNKDIWTTGPISSTTGPDRTPKPVLPKSNKRKNEDEN